MRDCDLPPAAGTARASRPHAPARRDPRKSTTAIPDPKA